MDHLITNIASYALMTLRPNTFGQIHSVYRKTINLTLGGRLLSLQAASSPISPISLITDLSAQDMEKLNLLPGQRVEIRSHELCICSPDCIHRFCYNLAETFDSVLTGIFPRIHGDLLKSVFSLSDTGGFRCLFSSSDTNRPCSDQFLINDYAKNCLKQCSFYLENRHFDQAADVLVSLIGLGIGLTPSGDDFLCGVLAGIIFADKSGHPFTHILKEAIGRHLNNTNDISRAFLDCALKSHFSKPVKELPFKESAGEILSSFEAIGHSSGIDTLCGIYYILTHL